MSELISKQAVLNTLNNMDKALDEERTVEKYKELLTECIKVLPSADVKRDFVEIPEGMTNGEVMNLILRKTFPRMIFIRGINEWNKTKSIVYAEEWENAPYRERGE